MSRSDSLTPFVVKFLEPLISPEIKMILLRFENDNGSKGCLGMHEECLETLRTALEEILRAMESLNNKESNVSNKALECALTARPTT